MLALVAVLAASAAVRSGTTEAALRMPVSDKDHATQDAAAVLQELSTVLAQEAKTETGLDDAFEAWCADAQGSRDLLRDEVDRRIREMETSLAQLGADEQRLKSEVGLSGAAQNATLAQSVALAATQSGLSNDVANELDLIARAMELTRHAVRLSNNHATEVDTEDGAAQHSGLSDTLSALLEELDVQRQAVVDERDQLVEVRVNLTDEAQAAGTFLNDATSTIAVEGRERARAAARYESELADLRRLVGSVGTAANTTQEVCAQQRAAVRDQDGVTAAEQDAVRTALESLGPDEVLGTSFVQIPLLQKLKSAVSSVFETRAKAGAELLSPPFLQVRDQSGIDKFTAFVARQAKVDPASPFAKAAAALAVVDKAAPADKAAKSDDPLAEIAAFGDSDAPATDGAKVTDTYEALEKDLQGELAQAKDRAALCADQTGHAKSDVERMGEEKSFADAKLAVLNSTAKELTMQEDYLQQQTVGVNESAHQLKMRVREEKELSDKATGQLQSFAQQLVSVSAGLARVGSSGNGLRKVAKEVERLVERVEGHVSHLKRRSEQYAEWQQRVDTSTAALERVLAVDLGHARRKSNEYATERAYTESMDRAKARDAEDAHSDAADADSACPPAKVEEQKRQETALVSQLHELHVLWGSMRV